MDRNGWQGLPGTVTTWLDPDLTMLRPRPDDAVTGPEWSAEQLQVVADPEASGEPDGAVGAASEAPVQVRVQAVSFPVAVVGMPGTQMERQVQRGDDDDDGDHVSS